MHHNLQCIQSNLCVAILKHHIGDSDLPRHHKTGTASVQVLHSSLLSFEFFIGAKDSDRHSGANVHVSLDDETT
jgi:hypothetical protein